MNLQQAQTMWDLAYAHWPPGSVFRYFARHPRGQVMGHAVSSPRVLADVTTWADKRGWNSYWQPNPTRRIDGVKCAAADVTHWCWYVLDLDPLPDAPPPQNWGWETLVLAPWVKDRLVVDSGRGLQLLFPVGPISLDDDMRWEVSRAMSFAVTELSRSARAQQSYMAIDTSCSDLPRAMRLPFTVNQKTGRTARILDTPTWTEDRYVRAVHILNGVPAGALVRPDFDTSPEAHWQSYEPRLTRAARIFLREGHEEPGRHKAATATMISLQENGATREQVFAALTYGASLCIPQLPPKDVEDMVARRFRGK